VAPLAEHILPEPASVRTVFLFVLARGVQVRELTSLPMARNHMRHSITDGYWDDDYSL
jgi:hypothetical protein